VFQRRPREARKALTALCSDIGITILLPALDRRDIVALPELPDLPAGDGADPTWARLTTLISKDPADGANTQWVRALRELLNQGSQFAAWWYEKLTRAIGTPQQTCLRAPPNSSSTPGSSRRPEALLKQRSSTRFWTANVPA
jgi:hypothetical protein